MSRLTQLQFLKWAQANHPAVFNAALKKAGSPGINLAGLADINTGDSQSQMLASQDAFGGAFDTSTQVTTTNAPPSILDQATSALTTLISTLAPAYASSKQASTCIQVNAQRAISNLPPVDCSVAGLAPQVAVGVALEAEQGAGRGYHLRQWRMESPPPATSEL